MCVREDKLLEQIATKLESIYIPQEFLDFALEAIHQKDKEENSLKEDRLARLRKEYDSELSKINNIKEMRINSDLSPEEYQERLSVIESRKETILGQINNLDSDINKQASKVEDYLLFAHTAYEKFKNCKDDITKREYLMKMGTFFSLKDKILTIELKPFFQEVLTTKELIKNDNFPLEPIESIENKGQMLQMYSSSPYLGAHRESNSN